MLDDFARLLGARSWAQHGVHRILASWLDGQVCELCLAGPGIRPSLSKFTSALLPRHP